MKGWDHQTHQQATVWSERTAHACEQPSSGFMQMDLHVGIGSAQDVRVRTERGWKYGAEEALSACLPQGQWVTREGERGQTTGVEDGG